MSILRRALLAIVVLALLITSFALESVEHETRMGAPGQPVAKGTDQ